MSVNYRTVTDINGKDIFVPDDVRDILLENTLYPDCGFGDIKPSSDVVVFCSKYYPKVRDFIVKIGKIEGLVISYIIDKDLSSLMDLYCRYRFVITTEYLKLAKTNDHNCYEFLKQNC